MKKVSEILKTYELHPVKSFGQNFLFDNNILEKITNITPLKGKGVIEIGPGLGHLTEKLIMKSKKVVSIEIDKKLIPVLQETFASSANLTIINDDFLKIDLVKLVATHFAPDTEIVVVANLPYYLTSPIVLRLIEYSNLFSGFILMMQKEVAIRFSSKPNNKLYNNLSVMIQFYTDVKIMFDVKPQCFYPAPNVTSTVVYFKVKEHQSIQDEIKFWVFVRSCFIQKRKTLINNLSNYLRSKEKAIDFISELKWPITIRAENLTFPMFYELFLKIKNNKQ